MLMLWLRVLRRQIRNGPDLVLLILRMALRSYQTALSCKPTMKFRMTKILGFWVDCTYEGIRDENPRRTKATLIARILCGFEEAGDAMRYLSSDGRIAWKATPRMLTRLADAEQEAREDLADWP
jgi:hypothetical protein